MLKSCENCINLGCLLIGPFGGVIRMNRSFQNVGMSFKNLRYFAKVDHPFCLLRKKRKGFIWLTYYFLVLLIIIGYDASKYLFELMLCYVC